MTPDERRVYVAGLEALRSATDRARMEVYHAMGHYDAACAQYDIAGAQLLLALERLRAATRTYDQTAKQFQLALVQPVTATKQ